MGLDPWSAAIVRFGILALLAPVIAIILRRSGLPGRGPSASIVGGILAGLIAGAMVLGVVEPGAYDAVMVGAREERRALASLEAQHGAELAALLEIGVSPVAIDERREEQRRERQPLIESRDLALARHRVPAGILATLPVAVAFFAGSILARRRTPRARDQGEVPAGMFAGLLVVAIVAMGTAVLASWLLRIDARGALLLGSAIAAGSAFSHMPMRWVGSEGRRLGASAINIVAFMLSLIVMILAMPEDRRPWLMPMVGGLFLASVLRGRIRSTRRRRRLARGFILWILVPIASAWLVSESDPRLALEHSAGTWFVVLAIALGGSGHFLGVWIGMHLMGTTRQRVRGSAIWGESHALGVGMTQLLLLVMLASAGVIDARTPTGSAIVVGLAIAIAGVEMSLGLLTRLALARG